MFRSTIIAALMLGSVALPAMAQEFTAVSTIDRIVTTQAEDGSVRLDYVEAQRVTPGENLLYKLTYDNASEDAADNVSLVMNVPAEVIYSENSAKAGATTAVIAFSTDDGVSFAPRGALTVSVGGEPRPASSEDITNIRLTFPEAITPGSVGTVSFEAVVR